MSNTEIVTPAEALAADLAPLAETINAQADLIHRHELATQEETILPRLLIGQSITKAKELFGLTKAEAGAIGGSKIRHNLLPENADPAALSLGFQAWLRKQAPAIKLPTAVKYGKAFCCLGLATDAKPAQITEAVKTLRHKALESGKPALSLALIIKSAEPKKPETEAIIIPGDSKTSRLHDAREAFHNWKDTFEKMLRKGQLDDLEKKDLESLKEFLLGVRDRVNARLK